MSTQSLAIYPAVDPYETQKIIIGCSGALALYAALFAVIGLTAASDGLMRPIVQLGRKTHYIIIGSASSILLLNIFLWSVLKKKEETANERQETANEEQAAHVVPTRAQDVPLFKEAFGTDASMGDIIQENTWQLNKDIRRVVLTYLT